MFVLFPFGRASHCLIVLCVNECFVDLGSGLSECCCVVCRASVTFVSTARRRQRSGSSCVTASRRHRGAAWLFCPSPPLTWGSRCTRPTSWCSPSSSGTPEWVTHIFRLPTRVKTLERPKTLISRPDAVMLSLILHWLEMAVCQS